MFRDLRFMVGQQRARLGHELLLHSPCNRDEGHTRITIIIRLNVATAFFVVDVRCFWSNTRR